MPGFAAAARTLAHAIIVAGSLVAISSALAAEGAAPLLVASLNPRFTEPGVNATTVNTPAIAPGAETTITGDASFYDEDAKTASGEPYDPTAFTAAVQILLRDQFGGIRFGINYLPSYGVAEYGGRKAIIKFNDVGPLRPGRQFDLSRAVMEYFDGIEQGILPHMTVTLLPLGRNYVQGPVTDAILASLEAPAAETQPAAPEAEMTTGSISARREIKCDIPSPVTSIDLDTILSELVVHGADAADDSNAEVERHTQDKEPPNDLGLVMKSASLP